MAMHRRHCWNGGGGSMMSLRSGVAGGVGSAPMVAVLLEDRVTFSDDRAASST
jgi:hypothetical protein